MGNDVGKPHALETCSGSVPYLIKILMLSTSGTKGPVMTAKQTPDAPALVVEVLDFCTFSIAWLLTQLQNVSALQMKSFETQISRIC